MLKTWFECKARFEKTMENGLNKKVTEKFLVDALSFTEAEARIIEELTPYISGEFTITDIKRAVYHELFFTEGLNDSRWYKVKLKFITLDERSGKEKITTSSVLVEHYDIRDAVKRTDEGMKGSMADYVIASITETDIQDVFEYEQSETPTQDDKIRNEAASPVVNHFLKSLPEGCKTEITINGKRVVIDKTEKGTKVSPVEE